MSASVDHTVVPSAETDYLVVLKRLSTILSSDDQVTLSSRASDELAPIPDDVRDLLRQAVAALADHKAVTISEQKTVLTTQEAADLLGVSRPTLVRLLERNAIPYTQPNRHRRILLEHLLEYQGQKSAQRRAVLDEMTTEAQDGDMYRNVNGFVQTR